MGCCNSSVGVKRTQVKDMSLSKLVSQNKKNFKSKMDVLKKEELEEEKRSEKVVMIKTKTTVNKKKADFTGSKVEEDEMVVKETKDDYVFEDKEFKDNELPLDDLNEEILIEKNEDQLLRKASLGAISNPKTSQSVLSMSIISQAKRLDTSENKSHNEIKPSFYLEKEDFFQEIGYSDDEELRRASLELGKSIDRGSSRSDLDDNSKSLDTSEDIIYRRATELDERRRANEGETLIMSMCSNKGKTRKKKEDNEKTEAIGNMTDYSKKSRPGLIFKKRQDSDDEESIKSGFVSIQQSLKSIQHLGEKSIRLPSVKRIMVDEMREDVGLRYDLTGGNRNSKKNDFGKYFS